MKARRSTIRPHNLRTALRGKRKITPRMTYKEFGAACPKLASFDTGAITVGRFAAQSPWERHPDGDELLHILDGKIEVTLLTDNGPDHVTVGAGSIFVVPRNVWHRQTPRPVATVLSVLPTDHGPVSFADDPR
jgi:mannose-6-phosphate isomerase-like protein (cupin superfamily)